MMQPSPDQFALESREQVISTRPFTVRRVARWSECDPAGVVYTGNFTEYLLSATHLFRRKVLQSGWPDVMAFDHVDTPAKSISMVFEGSLRPDDVFDTQIIVGDIRNRTFDFVAKASRADNGRSVFKGTLSVICISAADRTVAVQIPDRFRQLLKEFQSDGKD